VQKRIHVRIEHAKPSKCRDGFLQRVKDNDKKRAEAKKAGVKVPLKRTPALPRKGGVIRTNKAETLTLYPLKYPGLGW
jgi:large subunit ribosomal protein L21e